MDQVNTTDIIFGSAAVLFLGILTVAVTVYVVWKMCYKHRNCSSRKLESMSERNEKTDIESLSFPSSVYEDMDELDMSDANNIASSCDSSSMRSFTSNEIDLLLSVGTQKEKQDSGTQTMDDGLEEDEIIVIIGNTNPDNKVDKDVIIMIDTSETLEEEEEEEEKKSSVKEAPKEEEDSSDSRQQQSIEEVANDLSKELAEKEEENKLSIVNETKDEEDKESSINESSKAEEENIVPSDSIQQQPTVEPEKSKNSIEESAEEENKELSVKEEEKELKSEPIDNENLFSADDHKSYLENFKKNFLSQSKEPSKEDSIYSEEKDYSDHLVSKETAKELVNEKSENTTSREQHIDSLLKNPILSESFLIDVQKQMDQTTMNNLSKIGISDQSDFSMNRTKSIRKVKCTNCERRFNDQNGVRAHYFSVHRSDAEASFQPNPELTSTQKMNMTEETNTKATFSRRAKKQKSMRNSEKPFICPHCDVRCATKHGLSLHFKDKHDFNEDLTS